MSVKQNGNGLATRNRFIRGAAVAAGALLLSGSREQAQADDVIPGGCSDSVQTIINTALTAERLAMTFYYTGLTSPGVLRDRRLGGVGTDANHPAEAPKGNPNHVRYLQAALDAEIKHGLMLAQGGAVSTIDRFYFPVATFESLGHPDRPGTFLAVLDTLETGFADAYSVAVSQLLALGQPDLAELAARIMGVEAEHRTLARVIAGVAPANNLTLERIPYACVSGVGKSLTPFLDGKGFPGSKSKAVALPTVTQAARVVGRYKTRVVNHFL